jgi:bilin biosynthesis protein
MKLLGWLRYAPAYDLLVEVLYNEEPQFQKSRAAAAIALAELGDARAVAPLRGCFDSPIWDLRYAALMALERLGDCSAALRLVHDPDILIRNRAMLMVQGSLMV